MRWKPGPWSGRLVQFQSSFQSVVPIRLGQPQRRRPRSYTQLALTAAVMIVGAITFLVPGVGQMAIDTAGRLLQARQENGSLFGAHRRDA